MPYSPKALVTECFADTGSVAILLELSPAELNKQHGVGNVANVMKAKPDTIKLGLIDGDRSRNINNPFFHQFVEQQNSNGKLILLQNPVSQQHLIVVEPAIEKFLMDAASEAGLTVEEFPCIQSLDTMKQLCKAQELYKDEAFRRLIKKLKKEKPPLCKTLAEWITTTMNWNNPLA